MVGRAGRTREALMVGFVVAQGRGGAAAASKVRVPLRGAESGAGVKGAGASQGQLELYGSTLCARAA